MADRHGRGSLLMREVGGHTRQGPDDVGPGVLIARHNAHRRWHSDHDLIDVLGTTFACTTSASVTGMIGMIVSPLATTPPTVWTAS